MVNVLWLLLALLLAVLLQFLLALLFLFLRPLLLPSLFPLEWLVLPSPPWHRPQHLMVAPPTGREI